MSKKLILTFFAGILLGSGITWIVKSGNCTASKHPDNTNVADELRIAQYQEQGLQQHLSFGGICDTLFSSTTV